MNPARVRWPMARHVERQASRLSEMMERLDVDPVALARLEGGDAFMRARTECLHCRNAAHCLYWLEAQCRDAPLPEFCPNLPLFMRCKRR